MFIIKLFMDTSDNKFAIDSKDPCLVFPPEVVKHIFSYLSTHELGVSRNVSKSWCQLASTPVLWRPAIYRDIAFSSKNWAQLGTDLVKDVDLEKEMLSLPEDIVETLRRSAFPGKSIRETHVLVRMPKGLTINKLGEMAKKYFPNGLGVIAPAIVNQLGDKGIDKSVWLLMTKDVLPGSSNKSYSQQKNIVVKLAQTTRVPYQVPTCLEVATCMLAEYFRSKKRLFPYNYFLWIGSFFCTLDRGMLTRCEDSIQGFHIGVETFTRNGFIVRMVDGYVVGVAALRKF